MKSFYIVANIQGWIEAESLADAQAKALAMAGPPPRGQFELRSSNFTVEPDMRIHLASDVESNANDR